MEESIPLLDPGPSSGGQGNCQGKVECSDCSFRFGQVAGEKQGNCDELANITFFIDTGNNPKSVVSSGIYVRDTEIVLGEDSDLQEDRYNFSATDEATSHCFNCGSPDHKVNACPEPIDRELVSLSRQYFYFFQSLRGVVDFQRIHVVEEWRQQRLTWLDKFEPGKVCGPHLLAALGGQEGDWLANMARWGYPKGWFGIEDPRSQVRHLINAEHTTCTDEFTEDEPFFIFEDSPGPEIVLTENDGTVVSEMTSSDTEAATPKRWAQYPTSHFQSHLLPTYNGVPLPPIVYGSATYTAERHELWRQIISSPSSFPATPPWRLPGAFTTSGNTTIYSNCPPPPPSTEPPPLPSSPTLEPPGLPLTNFIPSSPPEYSSGSDELDMDLSE